MTDRPPVARYKLTVTISGNTHAEIERELVAIAMNFGYDTNFGERDTFHIVSGRATRELVCLNHDMTPERFAAELGAWWKARKEARDG